MRALFRVATGAAIASAISYSTIFTLPAESAMPFRQYQTAGDIPAQSFKRHEVIYGRVEKITDGDTFRVRHYPYYPLSIGKNFNGRLSDNTMVVRIYGVDCPEIAKFGNPSMPFGDEATEFTRHLVDHKVVRIKLLRKDQYNRAVAKVTTKGFLPFTKKDVTLQLAERGLATLYTGGGAEYDGKRDLIEKKIEQAKRRKQGMWKNGDRIETPAEYKRKAKQVANDNKVTIGHAARAY